VATFMHKIQISYRTLMVAYDLLYRSWTKMPPVPFLALILHMCFCWTPRLLVTCRKQVLHVCIWLWNIIIPTARYMLTL